MTGEAAFDVVVLGEVLLEVGTEQPFGHGVPARLQVSGDALNVAACAAVCFFEALRQQQASVPGQASR